MKVLVVGGSGLIGGDVARYLDAQGHEVTIMSRRPPTAPLLKKIPHLAGDYISHDINDGRLAGFDSLVFSAAADIRQVPTDGTISAEQFYKQVNDEAVPAFFKAAKQAGIQRAVYIGTFYPQIAPEKIGICPYVTSRSVTDKAVRAMSCDDFSVCSLNLPFVLGHIPGLDIPHIGALVAYAKGALPDLPVFAPKGGTNHISSTSVAQATAAALDRSESGKAYLHGDENLSWKDYLELWFTAAENPQNLEVRDDDHPLLPNAIMFAGPGATVCYEPETVEGVGYDRQQIRAGIENLVKVYSQC